MSTICVWVTSATSLPSSVSSRVCQTWVRRPRCTGVAVAMTVIPSFAPPMKLVLLSIVVVPLASSGKLITVAAAPTESANAMMERAEIRPNQHARHHAILPGFGEGHALQLGKWHFHRIDFFKRRHDRLSSRFSQLSYAGLTRVSIKLQKSLA